MMLSLESVLWHSLYYLLRKQQKRGIICLDAGSILFLGQQARLSVCKPYILPNYHVRCFNWFLKCDIQFLFATQLFVIAIGVIFQRGWDHLVVITYYVTRTYSRTLQFKHTVVSHKSVSQTGQIGYQVCQK